MPPTPTATQPVELTLVKFWLSMTSPDRVGGCGALLGNLRAVLTRAPTRCLKRHATPLGTIRPMRRQGRDDPDPWLGRIADAGCRDGRPGL